MSPPCPVRSAPAAARTASSSASRSTSRAASARTFAAPPSSGRPVPAPVTGQARKSRPLPLSWRVRGSAQAKAPATRRWVGLPDQDHAGVGGGLEPGRGVDRVARHAVLVMPPGPDLPEHDEPGLDPDPDVEALQRPLGGDLAGVGGDVGGDPEPGLDGPLGVVLVGGRDPEQAEHAVAEELVDAAP